MNTPIIRNGIIAMLNPNKLEKYVMDSLNAAILRLKDHNLVKHNPPKYIIQTALGLDRPHDPEWQPHAKYAKDNLADTATALKFVSEHYLEFQEAVDEMTDNFGNEFYEHIFPKSFDLVRLTSIVYNHIVDKFAHELDMLDE